MTHEYERTCWNCGSKDLIPDALGVKCNACGATWNKCLSLGAPELTYVPTPRGKKPVAADARHYRPSGRAARSARIARERKAKTGVPEAPPGHHDNRQEPRFPAKLTVLRKVPGD